jgi:hypothetical protein
MVKIRPFMSFEAVALAGDVDHGGEFEETVDHCGTSELIVKDLTHAP